MDIGLTSMNISQTNVQSAMNIGLMKKSMNDAETHATQLMDKMLPASAAPSQYGFDTYA